MAVKQEMTVEQKKVYDFWITLLKGTTYAVLTGAGTVLIQYMGDGVDLKQALILSGTVGILAGIKNVVKFIWNIDIDFAALKKPKQEE